MAAPVIPLDDTQQTYNHDGTDIDTGMYDIMSLCVLCVCVCMCVRPPDGPRRPVNAEETNEWKHHSSAHFGNRETTNKHESTPDTKYTTQKETNTQLCRLMSHCVCLLRCVSSSPREYRHRRYRYRCMRVTRIIGRTHATELADTTNLILLFPYSRSTRWYESDCELLTDRYDR